MEKHILYLDESGTHSFTDTRKPKSKHFVIAVLSLTHLQDVHLSGYFEHLKRKHAIDSGTPFHSYDIFENKASSHYLTPQKSRKLCDSLAEFINTAEFKYSVFYLNKENCRRYFKLKHGLKNKTYLSHKFGSIMRDISYDILATQAFWWFSDKIIKKGDKGSITAESRDHSDHSLLDVFLRCKNPDEFRPVERENRNYRAVDRKLHNFASKMHKHVTSLKFENKIAESPGLELADLISYVTFQRIESRLPEFKTKGLDILWRTIRKNMESGAPKLITKHNQILSRNRVHKISKFTDYLDTL